MKIFPIVTLLLFTLTCSLCGQPAIPPPGPVFDDTVVPRIDITIHPDTLTWIFNNPYSDIEFRAQFLFDNGSLNEAVSEVGFRLRGNTSRVSRKNHSRYPLTPILPGGSFTDWKSSILTESITIHP